jgi:hypothetical protein
MECRLLTGRNPFIEGLIFRASRHQSRNGLLRWPFRPPVEPHDEDNRQHNEDQHLERNEREDTKGNQREHWNAKDGHREQRPKRHQLQDQRYHRISTEASTPRRRVASTPYAVRVSSSFDEPHLCPVRTPQPATWDERALLRHRSGTRIATCDHAFLQRRGKSTGGVPSSDADQIVRGKR